MNKIKLVILILGISISTFAQGKRGNVEQRVEAKKIGYLTDKLDLSPEEAQVFWPLYNQYTDKLKSLIKDNEEASNNSDKNLNADAEIDAILKSENVKLEIRRDYISKFKKTIGSEKTLTLLKSERGFKKEMLKGLRKRKEKRFKGMMKEKKYKEDKEKEK